MDTAAADALAQIATRIDKAARRFDPAGRSVELVAVSKTFPATEIEPFLRAGQRVFGENRVQETREKWSALRTQFPGTTLHLIGPLQTNKVRDAVALFDVIETVDRERLAEALAGEMARQGRQLPCFVQVNVGGEAQKAGIPVDEAVAFVERCRQTHGLPVVGLMCIPPDGVPAGPYFAQLAMLARDAGVSGLSMGMSGDFETAIAMGATHVRVGSALFGQRPKAEP